MDLAICIKSLYLLKRILDTYSSDNQVVVNLLSRYCINFPGYKEPERKQKSAILKQTATECK